MTGRLTRAQARQLARQMGWRGSKAKRDNVARRRREIAVMRPMADLMRLRELAGAVSAPDVLNNDADTPSVR